MSRQLIEKLVFGLLLLVALRALIASDLLWRGNAVIYDALVKRWSAPMPDDVVIVAVDDASLESQGRWPWPRRTHAELINALTDAGVQGIGLNILFAETDRSDPEGDRELALALRRNGNVVLPMAFDRDEQSGALFELRPIPELAEAAAAIGHVDAELDRDSIARSLYLTAGLGHPHWPAFALALHRIQQPDYFDGAVPGVRSPERGDVSAYVWVRDHRVLVPFVGPPRTFARISAKEVLAGQVPRRELAGKLVLVGLTATNLGDALPTPVSGGARPMSGVEFSANVLAALRSGQMVIPIPGRAHYLLSAILVLLPLWLYTRLGPGRALAAALVLMGITAGLSAMLLYLAKLWFPPAAPLLVLACSYPLWSWRRLGLTIQSLRDEKERAQVTLHSIGDAVLTTDAEARITFMNPVAETWTGYTLAEAQGRRLVDVLDIRDEDNEHENLDPASRCLAERAVVALPDKSQLVSRRGRRFALRGSAAPITSMPGVIVGVVLALSDITETRLLAERLSYKATHDDLTQLPNRNLLSDRLEQAIANARRTGRAVAVLFVDLDRFKSINDTLGHNAGDELLKAVARRFEASTRAGDTVARLGGDEFVVVLQNIEHDEFIARVADKLLNLCPPPFILMDHELFVTSSIGISLFPKDADDGDTLLKYADIAMYRAKDLGRKNYQFYAREINNWNRERLTTEEHLRYAIEREQLVLFYQPQANLDNGQVSGVEALLRWLHPTRGLLMPANFIPLAEETGLIIPIGEWVLQTVCEQLRQLHEQGLKPLRAAINLSASQLLQRNLVKRIEQTIGQAGLDPRYLEFEITESVIMRDIDRAMAVLRELRELGAEISIDDFGTGYSSLSYLRHFPADRVKIDQSFIHGVIADPDDAAIALGVIAMGRGLGIEVVAEGVETLPQATFLKERQCHAIQGNYFCRPLPEAALNEFLHTRPCLEFDDDRPLAERTLLLVDDDLDMLNLMETSLIGSGYRVHTATNGFDGLNILASQRVGVIVCDEFMPEMSGNDFLARVRKLYPDCIRILLSGREDPASLIRAINEGAVYRFMSKPTSSLDLQHTLREAFLEYRIRQRGFQLFDSAQDYRNLGA